MVAMATVVDMGLIYITPLDCRPRKLAVGKHSAQLSFTGTELYGFEFPIGRNRVK